MMRRIAFFCPDTISGTVSGNRMVGWYYGWAAAKNDEAENYNYLVARGWESKSVEAQQAEASDKSAKLRPPMSPDEAGRWREKEILRLSRQRVLQQMEASQNSRHRKLLEDSLADLDEKLRSLGM
jgi:hypothetical protein